MSVIQIEVPDELLSDINVIAQQLGRPVSAVMQDAMIQYRDDHKRPTGTHLAIDIPPGKGLGEILKPWSTRAELLEDFFDDRH